MTEDRAALAAVARAHLTDVDAERWLALLRPSTVLTAAGGDEPMVGRLGGLPAMPRDVDWPIWEGHGPLSFVGEVDCAAAPAALGLPTVGSLALFFFDGQLDEGEAFVSPLEPDAAGGARMLYLPPGERRIEREPIDSSLVPHREVPLAARPELNEPAPTHPLLEGAFGPAEPPDGAAPHPVHGRPFRRAVRRLLGDGIGHRLGGHARPIQGPPEREVAAGVLGVPERPEYFARIDAEAAGWLPVIQIDSDDEAAMCWGDWGTLYWLMRPTDIAAGRFDAAAFTWQCS